MKNPFAKKSQPKDQTPVIIVVERDKIHLLKPGSETAVSMPIPEAAVFDLEVLDEVKLKQLVKELVAEQRARHLPSVVFLANSFVFTKPLSDEAEASKLDSGIRQMEADSFVHHLPFEDVVIKPLKLNKRTTLLAVNFALYETFLQALTEARLNLQAVLPLTVIPAEHTANLAKLAAYYQKYKDSLKNYVLWQPEPEEDDEFVEPEKPKANRVLILGLVLMIVLLLAVLVWDNQRDQARDKDSNKFVVSTEKAAAPKPAPTPSPEPVQEASPAATVSTTEDSQPQQTEPDSQNSEETVQIQVQNGTGQPGQAGSIATLFEEAGFVNVSVANASQQRSGQYLILNTDQVDADTLERVAALLTAADIEFIVRAAPSDQVLDIVIITAQ